MNICNQIFYYYRINPRTVFQNFSRLVKIHLHVCWQSVTFHPKISNQDEDEK